MKTESMIAVRAAFAAVAFVAGTCRADWRDEMWQHDVALRAGVTLRARAIDKPRAMKAYIVRIDLTTPGIGFTATDRAKDWGKPMPDFATRPIKIDTKRETTADFMMRRRAEGRNVVVAVNTSPWGPWVHPYNFMYGSFSGWNVSNGVELSHGRNPEKGAFFVVRKDGGVDITSCVPVSRTNEVAYAMCGFELLMTNGVPAIARNRRSACLAPRTAIGLTADRKTLVLLAVDGRQAGYSLGADLHDLCDILGREGVTDAVNMDGGGSTSLVVYDDANERPVMLNRQPRQIVRKNALNLGIAFDAACDVREYERTGAVHHSYEFHPVEDTPPPKGYVPFYISHYGRHGSRRMSGRSAFEALRALKDAQRAGALTAAGQELLAAVRKVAEASEEMLGELTWRGADEHRRLARRMFRRFSMVFAGGSRRVRCRATVYPRVLVSQTNFTLTLKELVPTLDFDFATGDRHQRSLNPAHFAKDRDRLFEEVEKKVDGLFTELVPADRILSRFFSSPKSVKRPAKIVRALFACASNCQCLRYELGGLDMYRFFEPDEIAGLSRCSEMEMYGKMGNSAEFGEDHQLAPSKTLLADFVACADQAIADGRIAADLRFGHDSGLWPLAGGLGIEGPGDRVPMAESYKLCPAWKWMSMASNLQMVFYRSGSGDALVKVLWNEREMKLRGLVPYEGPYYRWSDVKAALVHGN